jgi:hypothetical protein
MKGIRRISGREFLLCGRYSSRGRADYVADSLLREWEQTRVRRTPHRFGDWSVWVSGRRSTERVAIETVRLSNAI